jgi:hypothetical protein
MFSLFDCERPIRAEVVTDRFYMFFFYMLFFNDSHRSELSL